jgi:hypothetical protein
MAGFQTHITVSSVVGAGVAWLGHDQFGLGWSTCAVAGGLCAIGGMMPDLDSDSGVPARETISFAAAVAPMLLFNRLNHQFGIDVERMILFGAPIYLFVRFGLGTLLKAITIHRGMFHSLPAAAIAGMLAYLICDSGVSTVRWFKAAGFALGYISHLALDELWSVEVRGVSTRVKSSFGTALKLFGNNASANALCYGMLIIVALVVVQDRAATTTTTTIAAPQPATAPVPAPLPTVPMFTAPDRPREQVLTPERRPTFQARTPRRDIDEN